MLVQGLPHCRIIVWKGFIFLNVYVSIWLIITNFRNFCNYRIDIVSCDFNKTFSVKLFFIKTGPITRKSQQSFVDYYHLRRPNCIYYQFLLNKQMLNYNLGYLLNAYSFLHKASDVGHYHRHWTPALLIFYENKIDLPGTFWLQSKAKFTSVVLEI